MKNTKLTSFKKTIIAAILMYFGVSAYLYFNQYNILFLPQQHEKSEVEAFASEHNLQLESYTSSSKLPLYYLQTPHKQNAKTILFFAGNAMNFRDSYAKLQPFIEVGYNVVINIYRGYDLNAGKPTQNNFYTDAEYLYQTILNKGVSAEDIIIYGYSIGSATASYMAEKASNPFAVIIESGFSSMTDLAKDKYPLFAIDLLLKERFPSEKFIAKSNAPKLFLHGTNDEIVPFKFGEKLYLAAAEPKMHITIPKGTHSLNAEADIIHYLQHLNEN